MNPYELFEWLSDSPDHEIYLNSINDIDEFYNWISENIPGIEFEEYAENIKVFHEKYSQNKSGYYIAFWYGEFDDELYYHVLIDSEIIEDAGENYISFNEVRKPRPAIKFNTSEFIKMLSI